MLFFNSYATAKNSLVTIFIRINPISLFTLTRIKKEAVISVKFKKKRNKLPYPLLENFRDINDNYKSNLNFKS